MSQSGSASGSRSAVSSETDTEESGNESRREDSLFADESVTSIDDSFVDETAPYWKEEFLDNVAALQRRSQSLRKPEDAREPPGVVTVPESNKGAAGRAGSGTRRSSGGKESQGSKGHGRARSQSRGSSGSKREGSRRSSGGGGKGTQKRPAKSGPEGEKSAKGGRSRGEGSTKTPVEGVDKSAGGQPKQPPSYLSAYVERFGLDPKPAGRSNCKLCRWYEDTSERVLSGVLALGIGKEGELDKAKQEVEELKKKLAGAEERVRVAEAKAEPTGTGTRTVHAQEKRAEVAESALARVQRDYARMSTFGLQTPGAGEGESHVSAVVRAWTGGKWAGWYTINRLRLKPGADGKYKDDLWYVDPTMTFMYRGGPIADTVRRGLVARRWVATPRYLERLHLQLWKGAGEKSKVEKGNLKPFHENVGYAFGNEVVKSKRPKEGSG